MKRSRYWQVLLAFSLLLGIVGWFRPDAWRAARELLYPFENAVAWTRRYAVAPVAGMVRSVPLAVRNRDLEAEVERLKLDVAQLESVAAENRRLRAALAFPPPPRRRLVACPVVSRGGTTGWQRQVRLGKGAGEGIAAGDAALTSDGLVGRVSVVTDHTADVLLISDPNSRVSCELDPPPAGVDAVRGVLCGGGGRSAGGGKLALLYVIDPLRLRFLKRDAPPAPRTRVVTSGLGGVLPAGIPVGYLLDSSVEPNGLYREGEVAPAADLEGLRLVLVAASDTARKEGAP